MAFKQTTVFLLSIIFVLLSGCESDDDAIQEDNIAPQILGISKTDSIDFIDENNLVSDATLSVEATDSDGSIIGYNWTLLSNQTIELSGADSKNIRFKYPLINSEEPNIVVFDITVTDDKDAESSFIYEQDINDYLHVIVWRIDAFAGDEVELSAAIFGRESKINTLSWTVESDHEITLLDANTKTVSFVAPDVSEVDEISLQIAVTQTDGTITYSAATVKILPKQ